MYMLTGASKIDEVGERIAFLSRQFLDTPYGESTLVGNPRTPEELVVNLAALDCFTFIDYIEAMRMASSFEDFLEAVKKVRYREGIVSYTGATTSSRTGRNATDSSSTISRAS
jgi:hypothetical protein